MPLPEKDDMKARVEYCVGDSEVAVQLWHKTGLPPNKGNVHMHQDSNT